MEKGAFGQMLHSYTPGMKRGIVKPLTYPKKRKTIVFISRKLGRKNPDNFEADNFNFAKISDAVTSIGNTVQQVGNTAAQTVQSVRNNIQTIKQPQQQPVSYTPFTGIVDGGTVSILGNNFPMWLLALPILSIAAYLIFRK